MKNSIQEKIKTFSKEKQKINKINNTFHRLQEIQVLIKKESGLKELCMSNI